VKPSYFTYDHYNFLSDGTDGATFFANLAVVRAQAIAGGSLRAVHPIDQLQRSSSDQRTREALGCTAHSRIRRNGCRVLHLLVPVGSPESFGDGIVTALGQFTQQYEDVKSINATPECPEGTTEVGRDFQSNGVWLCVRADLAGRVFHIGNVNADAGTPYRVQGG
jgi:hypothetical protein